MFDNKDREIVTTAMELGTLDTTAKKIGTSKSTISKSISDEEEALGIRLFDKIGNRKRPTLAAKLYKEASNTIDKVIREFQRKSKNSPSLDGGLVRVGTSRSFTMDLVNPVIMEFHKLYPLVNFKTTAIGYEDELLNLLLAGDLDVVIVSNIEMTNYKYRLTSIPLFRLRPMLFVPINHPFAKKIREMK